MLNHFEILDGNKEVVSSVLSFFMVDIEDALPYYKGIYHGADAVISRGKDSSVLPVLPVYRPDDFVKLILHA